MMGVLRNNILEPFLRIDNPQTTKWLEEYTDYNSDNISIRLHRIYGNEIVELVKFWHKIGYDTLGRELNHTVANLRIKIFRERIVIWNE